MWNVNRKTLINILNSDSKCGFDNLSAFLFSCQSLLPVDDVWPLTFTGPLECVVWLQPVTGDVALRCPASHRWDLVALKIYVQKQEATSINTVILICACFFSCPLSLDRLCLNGLVPRCLQGQHNQVAIGRAEGVQLLHLIAYFIDLWPWWLAAYQCRVITIGHCEVE